jgi:hypothetical protein
MYPNSVFKILMILFDSAMSDNLWLCNHMILWCPCIAGSLDQEKSKSISYNFIHSWKGNGQKLAAESKIVAQKSYIWTQSHNISYLEPPNLKHHMVTCTGEFLLVQQLKKQYFWAFSYFIHAPEWKFECLQYASWVLHFFTYFFLFFHMRYPAQWRVNSIEAI